MQVEDHYSLLLGIQSPWEITSVDLKMAESRVDIYVEYMDSTGKCPECKNTHPTYDLRKTRTWRHLDTMQFSTFIHCQLPRINCPEHGVKSAQAPWANKQSGFTLMFEAFAIQVMLAAKSVEAARKLLGLNWKQLESIKHQAVNRGLARRSKDNIDYLGVDEKQFRKGHNYITTLVDIDQGAVLEVVEYRTEESCKTLIDKALNENQQSNVKAVCMDMWKAFYNAFSEKLPNASIVHDHFHISQYLNKAVDQIRKKENREFNTTSNNPLKKSKFLWLSNPENLSEEAKVQLNSLNELNLKVSKAWILKESFKPFWQYRSKSWAEKYFNVWYENVTKNKLPAMLKVADMLKNHIGNILTYFDHSISNAVAEGLNSKIQMTKSNARGYRSFEGFRVSILFHCGKLKMEP
ncbi:MAG: ISL3 family transposase [Pseudomonadales bacterium]|nr:ISL3 family transposase [Pseudomonadales bacterium]